VAGEPGESLSDSEKDEEEILDEGSLKADEEGSEDGFFVSDGYLSSNEVSSLILFLLSRGLVISL